VKWSAFSTAVEELAEQQPRVSRLLSLAQRFYLPSAVDMIVNKRHVDLFECYQLPFDCVAVLTETKLDGLPTQCIALAVAVDGATNAAERVCRPESVPIDAWLTIFSIVLQPSDGRWKFHGSVMLAKDAEGLKTYLQDIPGVRALLEQYDLERLVREFEPDTHIITTLCVMLSLKNSKTCRVAAPVKVNSKRARNGRAPLLDYHVLSVDGEVWDRSESALGSGTGLRSHLRRGHIRRLGNGHRVWVRQAYVHGSKDGFVSKEYDVDVAGKGCDQ
jgi:hypothetical protein